MYKTTEKLVLTRRHLRRESSSHPYKRATFARPAGTQFTCASAADAAKAIR